MADKEKKLRVWEDEHRKRQNYVLFKHKEKTDAKVQKATSTREVEGSIRLERAT